MSSLRHSVLEKSLRKSMYELRSKSPVNGPQHSSETVDTSNESIIGNTSQTSARVRVRKKRNSKKVAKNKENNKQTNQANGNLKEITFINEKEIAQSSAIADAEIIDKYKAAKHLTVLSEKQVVNDDPCISQRSSFDKMSKQNLTDFAVEYKYKYERLCHLNDQLKSEFCNLRNLEENKAKDLISVKKSLQEHNYQLESDKFSLEEQLEKLTNENQSLQAKLKEYQIKEDSKKDPSQKADFHESMSQSPRVISRMKRRSMINQTLTAMTSQNDTKSKEGLYEDIIIDQQELLDFYSLLCGISICKGISPGNDSTSGSDEEVSSINFKCKLQIPKSSHDGIEFDMNLDYNKHEIRLEGSPTDDKNLPTVLQKGVAHDVDEGYLLQRDLLNSVL